MTEISLGQDRKYPTIVRFEPTLGTDFKRFDIDGDALEHLAGAMGANEAIERRLALNPDSPRELSIAFLLNNGEMFVKGAYYPARRGVSGDGVAKVNTDIEIYPVNVMLGTIGARELRGLSEPEFSPAYEIEIAKRLDRTIRHEIGHFCRESFDRYYAAQSDWEWLEVDDLWRYETNEIIESTPTFIRRKAISEDETGTVITPIRREALKRARYRLNPEEVAARAAARRFAHIGRVSTIELAPLADD